MKFLIYITLLTALCCGAFGQTPNLLVPADKVEWANPVYSPDGNTIAFADASAEQIQLWERDTGKSRKLVASAKPGRRFVFEPAGSRLIFRRIVTAIPSKPERLFSVSLYLYDPVSLTANETGNLFGPYLFHGQVWYRESLQGPFLGLNNQQFVAGPRLDRDSGKLWILGLKSDTLFSSAPGSRFAGAEISPDGQWVAAVQQKPGLAVVLVNLTTGATREIPNAAAPSWAGDSRSLVCVVGLPGSKLEIFQIPTASGTGRAIPTPGMPSPETPASNYDGSRVAFISDGALYELNLAP